MMRLYRFCCRSVLTAHRRAGSESTASFPQSGRAPPRGRCPRDRPVTAAQSPHMRAPRCTRIAFVVLLSVRIHPVRDSCGDDDESALCARCDSAPEANGGLAPQPVGRSIATRWTGRGRIGGSMQCAHCALSRSLSTLFARREVHCNCDCGARGEAHRIGGAPQWWGQRGNEATERQRGEREHRTCITRACAGHSGD